MGADDKRVQPLVSGNTSMRYVYMALIVVLSGTVILFKVQNIESATVSMFSLSVMMPTFILVFSICGLGILTGGMTLTPVRSLISGATRKEL
jgi:lipopolysaccharide assembly protein A